MAFVQHYLTDCHKGRWFLKSVKGFFVLTLQQETQNSRALWRFTVSSFCKFCFETKYDLWKYRCICIQIFLQCFKQAFLGCLGSCNGKTNVVLVFIIANLLVTKIRTTSYRVCVLVGGCKSIFKEKAGVLCRIL